MSTRIPLGLAARVWTALALASASAMAYCGTAGAEASHAGWPHIGHLEIAGPAGGVLRGLPDVHNELLGGNGNDTIFAGNKGDVIWGDKNPSGQPTTQRDYLHGGPGNDWIYSSHGFNEIWTGAGNDRVMLVYGYGVVHCDGPGLKTLVMRYLPENRPWKLIGCSHMKLERYRA